MMDAEVNATKIAMVYMVAGQALMIIGDKLFKAVWNATVGRWTAGEPMAAAEPSAMLAIMPGSPNSAFDFQALEDAEVSANNDCPAGNDATDPPDEPQTDGKLWTKIVETEMKKMAKIIENNDKQWQNRLEQTERASEHKINSIYEAIKQSQELNDIKVQNVAKQMAQQTTPPRRDQDPTANGYSYGTDKRLMASW